MKFCFIIPLQLELEQPGAYISLGVAYLGAVLENYGYEVQIHDMNIDGEVFPEANVYGITCVSATFPSVHKIVSDLCQKGRIVIVGGIHPSIQPDDFKDLNCYIVTGEAEDILSKILKIKNKPEIINAGFIQDIDKLPFPARHLFKNVVDYSGIHGQDIGVGATTIVSSRGCPYNCNFCTRIPQTQKVRFHSPEHMINELKTIISEYSIRHFRFVDDIFTLNKDRVMLLCDKLINEKLGITWICITRADKLGKDLTLKMKKAGCTEIHIGVESGSQRILDLMNKGISIESLENAIKLIKETEIKAKTYLMYGFPGETIEDRQMTIDFIRKNKPDKVTISKFTAMPGSKMWKLNTLGTEQWFYQDYDLGYQNFKNKIKEVVGEHNVS